jgi:hypothetical protein
MVDPYKEELPVTNLEAGSDNKCASPYIGERFGKNSVGGKWLMGAVLRIPLTRSSLLEGVWLRKCLRIKDGLAKVCSQFPTLLSP